LAESKGGADGGTGREREEKKINPQGGAAALLGRDRFRFRVLFVLSPKSVKLPSPLMCVVETSIYR
jgi:hypothetical protein